MLLSTSAAASNEAHYMRQTQASRSRSNAAGPKPLLRNWAATEAATTAANSNQNNNRSRYAAIGLISRKKQTQQSMPGRSDKENGASMDI